MNEQSKNPGIKRGQLWYISNDATHYQEGVYASASRPGLIVSSDEGNAVSPIVNVVWLTSVPKNNSVAQKISGLNRNSWALCNQIGTINKSCLVNYIGMVSNQEMKYVNRKLGLVLGVKIEESTDEPKKEPEPVIDPDDTKIELAFYKKAYESMLEKYVALKVDTEVAARMPVPEEPITEVQSIVSKPDKIVYYDDTEDDETETKDDEITPVNVNTCTYKDLVNIGFGLSAAYSVIGTRKQIGKYSSLEELKLAPKFPKSYLTRFEGRLRV